MKIMKNLLLATCAVATIWEATATAGAPLTHEEWKKQVEGCSTPRRMAEAYGQYEKFAKENPTSRGEGPKATTVMSKFRDGLRVKDLDTLKDTYNKAMEFQKDRPDARVPDYGRFGNYEAEQVLTAYREAFKGAKTPDEKEKYFSEAMDFQTKYPDARIPSYGRFGNYEAELVLTAYREAFKGAKTSDEKEKYFSEAMDFQTKYPAKYPGARIPDYDRFDNYEAEQVLTALFNDFDNEQDPVTKAEHCVKALAFQTKYANARYATSSFYAPKKNFVSEEQTPKVHLTFQKALQTSTPEETIPLYEAWRDFNEKYPSRDQACSPEFAQWKTKYEQAQADLRSKGQLVLASDALKTTRSEPSDGGFTVQGIYDEFGLDGILIPSSALHNREEFQAAFGRIYRTASHNVHPDKKPKKDEKMRRLNAVKEFVEGLTDDNFK